jgi:hypothetical protein
MSAISVSEIAAHLWLSPATPVAALLAPLRPQTTATFRRPRETFSGVLEGRAFLLDNRDLGWRGCRRELFCGRISLDEVETTLGSVLGSECLLGEIDQAPRLRPDGALNLLGLPTADERPRPSVSRAPGAVS